MADLKNPKLMHLKGWLFLFLIVGAAAGILLHAPAWRIAILIAVLIWASARFYYYLFYVIEHYIDPDFKFAGLYAALRYLLSRNPRSKPPRGE